MVVEAGLTSQSKSRPLSWIRCCLTDQEHKEQMGSNSECVPSSRQLRNITLRIYFWFNLCPLRNLRTTIFVRRFHMLQIKQKAAK